MTNPAKTEAKHMATPWDMCRITIHGTQKCNYGISSNGDCVAELKGEFATQKSNKDFILRACNSIELTERNLANARESIDWLNNQREQFIYDNNLTEIWNKWVDKNYPIAKAEGK